MSLRFLFPFFLLISLIQAESIKSITGNIIFDINNDGTSEAKLTSDGLAIGDGLSPSSNLHVQGNVINTGDLVVGGTTGNSTLEIQGTVGYNTQTISSNTTLSGNSIILVNTSSDNVTVTLPYAGNVIGRQYVIKKTSTSNEVTLNGGGNIIDSSSTYTFSSGNSSSMKVVSNGSQWYVLDQSSSGVTAVEIVASANLVGWWKLDETSGTTAVDSSGKGNDGTLTNMAGTEWESAKINGGLKFVASDYVNAGSDSSITLDNNFTHTFWVKFDSVSGTQLLTSFSGTGGYFTELFGGKFAFGRLNQAHDVTGTTVPSTSTWYFVAYTVDSSGNVEIFVDGSSDKTGTTTTQSHTGKTFYLTNTGYDFLGVLDDVRVYNKVLTDTEIQSIYNEGQ